MYMNADSKTYCYNWSIQNIPEYYTSIQTTWQKLFKYFFKYKYVIIITWKTIFVQRLRKKQQQSKNILYIFSANNISIVMSVQSSTYMYISFIYFFVMFF